MRWNDSPLDGAPVLARRAARTAYLVAACRQDSSDTVARFGNSSYSGVVSKSPATANLLRTLRLQQGQSLRSAAASIGVAPSQLSRLERGQRSTAPDVADRISDYYRVEPELVMLAQGVIPEDIVGILQSNPQIVAELRSRFNPEPNE